MHKLALQIAFLSLLIQPGFAQEVLVDEWAEEFVGYQKVGYSHRRVSKTTAGYLSEVNKWWPTATGVARTKIRRETDGEGRLIHLAKSETTDLGTTLTSAKLEGDVLSWSLRRREQPELKGRIKEAVHSSSIVALLVARGKRKPGELKLRVLDLPKGSRGKTYAASRDGDQLLLTDEESIKTLDSKGALVQAIRNDIAGNERVPASEAQAKDMSRKPSKAKPVQGVSPGVLRAKGITLKSPGKGWALAFMPTGEGGNTIEGVLIVSHPHEVFLMGTPLPIALPADKEGLELSVAQILKGANRDPDMRFSGGRVSKAWGLPALEYLLEATMEGALTKGKAWLLRRNGSQCLLVMLVSPIDKQKETAALVEAARASLSVEALPEPKAQVAVFPGGLSLQLPGDWKQKRGAKGKPRNFWISPVGSQLKASWQAGKGAPLKDALEAWAKRLATKYGATRGEVREFKLGERNMLRTLLAFEISEIPVRVRLIMGASGGGKFKLMALDSTQEEEGLMEKILASAKWTKAR